MVTSAAGDHMFQDAQTFAGAGIGIAQGTQQISAAPELDPGIHLRWASAPARGFPRYGYYLFRRPSSTGRTKPVSVGTERGQSLIESSHSSLEGDRATRAAASDGSESATGTGPFGWVEIEFADGSYVSGIDVLFTAGDCGGVTITAWKDGSAIDTATVDPGPIPRQTVQVSGDGEFLTALRVEGDLGLVVDARFYAMSSGLDRGWAFTPGVDQPLALPLANDDYPAATAPATVDAARTLAADRIAYGLPDRYAAPRTDGSNAGTVTATGGSPVVEGAGTAWTDDLAGEVLQVDGDDDAYTVLAVLATDRLLLARAYGGADVTGASYSLERDRFGTIHDSLATLVEGGPSAGGMAARAVPRTVVDDGTVTRTAGSTTVTGQGTGFDASLEGLSLQVARPTSGTVELTPGETTVAGVGTDWDEGLAGAVFVIDGQRTRYEVASVTGPAELELDRPYVGPAAPGSGGGREYTAYERDVARVERVVSATELDLAHPHAGETHDSGRAYRLVGSMTGGAKPSDGAPIRLPAQYPLETLAVASIDPAMAQALGTYWVDDTVETDVAYDYLLVADRTGVVDLLADIWDVDAGDAEFHEFVDDLLVAAEYDLVDGYLITNLVRGDADPSPPAAPTGVRVYDLPESTATATDRDRYAAGLHWDRDEDDGRLPVDAPAAYYLWRDSLGDDPGTQAPGEGAYEPAGPDGPVTDFLEDAEPVLVAGGGGGRADPGWPAEPVFAIDGRRPPGWYSYRVSAVDLFGRHSSVSEPATWHDGATGAPATHPTHPNGADFAVELRARLPPPPPAGVTAEVLDPQDPKTADDDAAVAWWDANGERTALRIGWTWPAAFDAQAPDTDAFECHVQPGSLNSHPGTVTAVNEGPDTTRVTTSLSHTIDPTDGTTVPLSAGAFAGAALHVAGAQFTVVDSGGGSGLWVDVHTPEGPDGPLTPVVDVDCALAVPAVYSRGTATVVDGDDLVTGEDTGWTSAHESQPFRAASTGETYTVAAVESPTRLRLGRPYEAPPNRDDREAVAYAIDHPASTDYSDATAWAVQVADVAIADDLPGARTAEGDRSYETIVVAPGADGGAFDPGVGPGESPVVHANVGVCARVDAPDGPMRGDVGGPAPVARVHRDPPDPPTVPPLSSEVDPATRPDYDGTAHYTVRWEHPPDGVKTHVYRAMDRTLFRIDRARRTDDPYVLEADDTQYFPPDLRTDDPAQVQRRDEITATLTTGLDVPDDAAVAVYEGLEPDEFRTLAALPGNEDAFSQLTIDPLAAEDAPNVRGPDYESGDPGPGTQPGVDGVPASMPPGDALCAYVDGFDGNSRNRYLYRVAGVDDAHNRSSGLSYPTPPTRARDAVPPERPVVTGIVAGHPDADADDDRRITLRWNAVRSPDLARYRVYRTDDPDATRDVRLMDEVAQLAVPVPADGDPLGNGRREGPEVVWTDDERAAGVDWHYRVVAEDESDNASAASTAVAGRAFDTTPPTLPTLTTTEWVRVGPDGAIQPYSDPTPSDETWSPAVRVTWDDPGDLQVLVERATGTGSFEPATGWLAGETTLVHDPGDEAETYRYRLRVLDGRGRGASGDPRTVAPPGGA